MNGHTPAPNFAACVSAEGDVDLTLGMVYRLLDDDEAAAEGLLRVVDDSGEDYLYPASRFVAVSVDPAQAPALLAASTPHVA